MSLLVFIPDGSKELKIVPWSSGDMSSIQSMLVANASGEINISDYWAIGNTRNVDFTTTTVGSTSATWIITSMNGTTSGGTAYSAIIHTHDCLGNSHYMNSSRTNAGGWSSSYMRNTVMNDVYNGLPNNFKAILRVASIVSGAGSASATTQTTNDRLWLFAEKEVQGSNVYGTAAEASVCTHFDYFKIASNKIKTGYTTSENLWYLRTPTGSYATGFCSVFYNGDTYYDYAETPRGVVPAAAI